MPLHPRSALLPVPEDTARVAHAAFRRGNPCLLPRDRPGVMFEDADFADPYPRRGQITAVFMIPGFIISKNSEIQAGYLSLALSCYFSAHGAAPSWRVSGRSPDFILRRKQGET